MKGTIMVLNDDDFARLSFLWRDTKERRPAGEGPPCTMIMGNALARFP